MADHDTATYERLLQIWDFRRQTFNRYARTLSLLMLDGALAEPQRREISEKLAQAERALREASERLRFYEIAAS